MTDNKEVIKRLIEEYNIHNINKLEETLAEHIANQQKAIQRTEFSVSSIEKRKIKEKERHRLAMKELDQELRKVQEECRHLSTTYYPDASGNNDSHVECNHCKKWSHRLKTVAL